MANIIIAVLAISAVFSILMALNRLSQGVDEANRSLRQISQHLGIHDAMLGQLDKELKELVRKGEKIKAIKLYREKTRLGLKEAHDYIQELDLGENDESLSD